MMMMGRNMSYSQILVAYGVFIRLPQHPCWPIFANRLEAFVANKAEPKLPSLPPTVLVSLQDKASMTKEEKEMIEEYEYGDPTYFDEFQIDANTKVNAALEAILGEDHGLTMKYICAASGYEWDGDLPIPPVFLLASQISLDVNHREPSADGYDLELATISEEECDTTEKKISLVLDELGLETTTGDRKPGWKLAASNTCDPR